MYDRPGFGLLFAFIFFLASSLAARASELCSYYQKNLPDLYKVICKNGSSSSKPAGANSSFSDSFNLSSASLPTEPSSYGLEIIESFLRDGSGKNAPTFSLVKGFHKFGAGISTSSNNTFYGNDVIQRLYGPPLVDSFLPHELAKGKFTNLNLGTSIALIEEPVGPTVRLGLSLRYNYITDSWGGGPAVILSGKVLSVGAGFTREQVSNTLPSLIFVTYIASLRISSFEFEYNLLGGLGDYNLTPIHIFTTTLSIRKFTLSAAVRTLNYIQAGNIFQFHYAFQYLFTKHLSAGALFNFIPGANSVGFQIYL